MTRRVQLSPICAKCIDLADAIHMARYQVPTHRSLARSAFFQIDVPQRVQP